MSKRTLRTPEKEKSSHDDMTGQMMKPIKGLAKDVKKIRKEQQKSGDVMKTENVK